MSRRILAAITLAGCLSFVGSVSQAVHDGCIVLGEVQGLDTERHCTYVASTPQQFVYVGTPFEWRVWVLREDPSGEPVDVTLASGAGPVVGPPPEVRPLLGETVHVTMMFGCSGPYCGTIGFLAAGLEQGHP